jgi:hypothetical protein
MRKLNKIATGQRERKLPTDIGCDAAMCRFWVTSGLMTRKSLPGARPARPNV